MARMTRQNLAVQIGAVLLLSGALGGLGWWRAAPRGPSTDNREIEDLVSLMQRAGLKIRAVPIVAHRSANSGAHLTTTDKSREQLAALPLACERIKDWEGTVYCGRAATCDPQWDTRMWGSDACCERLGPFILFGDPKLRARIREALRDSGRVVRRRIAGQSLPTTAESSLMGPPEDRPWGLRDYKVRDLYGYEPT